MFKALVHYFELHPSAHNEGGEYLPLGKRPREWPQWGALFLGILIQPFFDGYKQNQRWEWHGAFWGWFFFALVTSVLIFPAVYRKVLDPDAPVVVALGPIFAAGLGWESLIGTIMKAAQH